MAARLSSTTCTFTPESHVTASHSSSKVRRLAEGFDKLNLEDEFIPLSHSVNSHITSLPSRQQPEEITLTIQYRAKMPQQPEPIKTPSVNCRTERTRSQLFFGVQPSTPVISTRPVERSANRKPPLPAVLIAKLLTTQGHGSHFPQLYPTFKDATLLPTQKLQTSNSTTPTEYDYSQLKARFGFSPTLHYNVGNETPMCSNVLQSPTPILSNTSYSVVFPKRYRRKSWRRNLKL